MLEKLNFTLGGVSAADILITLVIFLVGWAVIKYLCRLLDKMLKRTGKLDGSVRGFLLTAARVALTFILIISCAQRLGIPTTSLVTLLGTAGLALSLSLQDLIKNLAGGILLLVGRQIRAGDFVELSGVRGTVQRIGLIHTAVNTLENSLVYIPNGTVTSGIMTNHTGEERRRTQLVFPVPYGCDIAKAKQVLADTVRDSGRTEGEPYVRVMALSASSVDIVVRAYVNAADFADACCVLLEEGMLALEKAGIDIPFNQLDVNLYDKRQ
ncbi:MAG: mechanosensitive ion channel family protein [Clostridia bacterium]|nr:mechanosensitive ion channel family protein [Clostridia bacterium]